MVQMFTLGINQLFLFDEVFKYYAQDDGLLMTLRNFVTAPFSMIIPDLSDIGITIDQDEEAGRLVSFERSIKEIVTESEKRIYKTFKKTEENILSSEEELKYCLVDLMDNIPNVNKKGDSDDDSYSDSSSHITFTREDLGLGYP